MKLFFSLLLCIGGGLFIGSLSPIGALEWYQNLEKSPLTPPGWVFGPVWTLLYLMMGVSLWLIWKNKKQKVAPYIFFFGQLGCNFLWMFLFAGLKSPFLALLDLGLLLLFLIGTVVTFWKIRPLAGALQLPYLAWSLFALYLNFAIWSLN